MFFVVVIFLHNKNNISVGGDIMYEMRRRKSEPTLLPTDRIFNLPHHIGMICWEPAFDDAVSYTQQGNGLQRS